MADIQVIKASDLFGLSGVFRVLESGEELDAADLRFLYDGQKITLRKKTQRGSGDCNPDPERPLSRADEMALSALADYYDEEARA